MVATRGRPRTSHVRGAQQSIAIASVPCGFGASAVLSRAALALFLAGATFPGALLAQDTVEVPPEEQDGYSDRVPIDDPEEPLNCEEVYFPELGIRAILQNDDPDDPVRSSALRALAKAQMRHALLEHDGQLRGYLSSGELYGIEFDWFFPEGVVPPKEEHLPGSTSVMGQDEQGAPLLLARIYAYDAAQYAVRKAHVEAMVGHEMRLVDVSAEPVVVATSKAGARFKVKGKKNTIHGLVLTGGRAKVEGKKNQLLDGLGHVDGAKVGADDAVLFVRQLDAAPATEPPPGLAALREQAIAAGTWFPGAAWIDAGNLPPQGVIFAEGSLTLWGEGIAGRYTLVSAKGPIYLLGHGMRIDAAEAEVVAYAPKGAIHVLGDAFKLEGVLLAPKSTISLGGDDGVLLGRMLAERVRITGDRNLVSDGTHPLDEPLPEEP